MTRLDPPAPASTARAAWTALLLALVSDALLAPFYPQFFARTFGGDGVVTAGLYVALCRIAVAIALPFWTRWTRRVAPLRLVAIAQGVAGCATLGCALAPSLGAFLVLTAIAESARAAYLLLYPVLFAAAPPERRGAVVAQVAAAFHAAALLAAVLGGVVLDHLGGRSAIAIAAIADFAQLAFLARQLRGARPAPAPEVTAPPSAAARARARRRLALLCALSFLATSAIVILRPHFTTFLADGVAPSAPLWLLGAVFVVPSAVAVLVLPLGPRVAGSPRLALYLALALAAMAVTAGGQLLAPSLLGLVAARALYGLASYVVDVGVDFHALAGGGDDDDAFQHFGVVGAVQNASIVVAPLAAAVLVERAGWPALFGAGIALSLAAAAAALTLRASQTREAPAPISVPT